MPIVLKFILAALLVVGSSVVFSLLVGLAIPREYVWLRLMFQVPGGFAIGWYGPRLLRLWMFPAPRTIQVPIYCTSCSQMSLLTCNYTGNQGGLRQYVGTVDGKSDEYRIIGVGVLPMDSELEVRFLQDPDVVVEKSDDH